MNGSLAAIRRPENVRIVTELVLQLSYKTNDASTSCVTHSDTGPSVDPLWLFTRLRGTGGLTRVFGSPDEGNCWQGMIGMHLPS